MSRTTHRCDEKEGTSDGRYVPSPHIYWEVTSLSIALPSFPSVAVPTETEPVGTSTDSVQGCTFLSNAPMRIKTHDHNNTVDHDHIRERKYPLQIQNLPRYDP